jgi:collagenase-like PrtC family protease|tara:strand:+ start:1040 stop:1303 length:264 start_codon:yes stop_codon:yes gene_type:complete
MDIKLTKQFQKKLELLLESQEYKIRFEKGNFKSGYCIIRDKKVIIVNKYFTLEGKINALIEIIESLKISPNNCSKEHVKTLNKILEN